MASSGSRPVAASETTQTSVRVLRSRPGRVQRAPNTVSVATSMNFRMTGSLYVVLLLAPRADRRRPFPRAPALAASRALAKRGADVLLEKFDHRLGEGVVLVTGDHVGGAADIHGLGAGDLAEELLDALLGDHVAELAPEEQGGDADGS